MISMIEIKGKNKTILKTIFVILVFLLFFVVYRNLGKHLLTDRFVKGSIFNISAGVLESSIPKKVLESKELMDKYSLDNFRLSNSLKNDSEILQRVTEFTYPKKLIINSSNLIAAKDEVINEECTILTEGETVVIYKCK